MITVSDKPTVSVIIPCFNGGKFVAQAIESVLNQSYDRFEIIVVDDGSSDNSVSIIKPYLTDTRIKLIKHEVNKGIPAARNTGIRASTGELIAFLDQDDLWLPEKLEKQVAVFLSGGKELGLVFTNLFIEKNGKLEVWPEAKRVPKNIANLPSQQVLKSLFFGNFIPMTTVMVRREAAFSIGLLDEAIKGGADDYDFCLRMVAAGFKVDFIPFPLAIRRIHKANYSNIELFVHDHQLIYLKIIAQAPFLVPLVGRRKAIDYYSLGRWYLDRGDFKGARKALWTALRLRPTHGRTILVFMLSYLGPIGNMAIKTYRYLRESGRYLFRIVATLLRSALLRWSRQER